MYLLSRNWVNDVHCKWEPKVVIEEGAIFIMSWGINIQHKENSNNNPKHNTSLCHHIKVAALLQLCTSPWNRRPTPINYTSFDSSIESYFIGIGRLFHGKVYNCNSTKLTIPCTVRPRRIYFVGSRIVWTRNFGHYRQNKVQLVRQYPYLISLLDGGAFPFTLELFLFRYQDRFN